jgi:hypothetical protein
MNNTKSFASPQGSSPSKGSPATPTKGIFKELFSLLSSKSSSCQKQELEQLQYLYGKLYDSYKYVQDDLIRCKKQSQSRLQSISELEAEVAKYKINAESNLSQDCKDDYLVEHIKMMFERVVMENVEKDSTINMLKRDNKRLQDELDRVKQKYNINEKSGMEELDDLISSLQED